MTDVSDATAGKNKKPIGPTLRPGGFEKRNGIKRPLLYSWFERGLIRMIKVKPPGARRGITLIPIADVDAVLEQNIESGTGK